ncbi:MAG: amidase [Persicimonas sp.]
MNFEEYRKHDAVELARMVRDKEVTSIELIQAAAQGLAAWDGKLNALVESWVDSTREECTSRDPASSKGPLAGVPFLLKDMLEWEGRAMTLGSRLLDGYIAERTHPLVERYVQAGLVPIGRTNMSELGLMPLTEPTVYGPTRNPWDLTRSPGGSSGGSAAAVAAGIVPVAHAADGGGSIRIPASACGLFGFKPTRGRTVEALDEVPEGFVSHHCVSRSVRDSALLLDLSSGASPGSRWRPPAAVMRGQTTCANAVDKEPDALRVGMLTTDFLGESLHPACREAVEDAAKLCMELGHEVVEVTPPFDGLAYRAAFSQLWAVGASFFLKRARAEIGSLEGVPAPLVRLLQLPGTLEAALRAAQVVGHPMIEPLTLRLARHSDRMAPADLWLIWQALNEATADMTLFFEEHDVLLTSTLTEPPWKIGHYDQDAATLEEVEEDLFAYAGLTPIANTAGLPAMSVPLYRSEGLPIGAQFIGPHASECRLLSLAGQLERARPWDEVAVPS